MSLQHPSVASESVERRLASAKAREYAASACGNWPVDAKTYPRPRKVIARASRGAPGLLAATRAVLSSRCACCAASDAVPSSVRIAWTNASAHELRGFFFFLPGGGGGAAIACSSVGCVSTLRPTTVLTIASPPLVCSASAGAASACPCRRVIIAPPTCPAFAAAAIAFSAALTASAAPAALLAFSLWLRLTRFLEGEVFGKVSSSQGALG
mmetsp:Transcript_46318/g.76643  ORF Transcript_46318/g.76643 Transcript_46318/m.76643 type:complete len:211 (-) Transcript_46318:230-862(-)